jgi:hypothetical protein
MKKALLIRLLALARLIVLGSALALTGQDAIGGESIPLVVDGQVGTPVERALTDLEQALQDRQTKTIRQQALPKDGRAIVVGVAGSSPLVDQLIGSGRAELPKGAESLCIRWITADGRSLLVVAGRDSRGLSYALLEVARAVELAPNEGDLLGAVREMAEAPSLAVRSLTIHPFNADVDAEWYFDERFWRSYFTLLARCRFNNFTLTFADQTNYLNPPYAYLVEVPEYRQVRVRGLTAEGRQRNLQMLGRIAVLARERGLDFTLGIWMQAPVPRYSGKVLVENLPEGTQAADYCARGMALVLRACPAIGAVQLRMNAEAGVPEDQQTDFYRPLFRAVRQCGRPVGLDLRYKGLRPETTQAALGEGLAVTISTKFWCEHLGLPYHPTAADSHYRGSRYSFGTLLAYPREYRVVYRLWSVGSQRLLLWGDPEYAARFARSCRLGGGEGFEVFAPLTNKGYGNEPGRWPIFADRAYAVGPWEFERYWFFYLAFGRLGYNPQANPEVWRRELRYRFGAAAADMEKAYRAASQVLPLITATRLPGASEWNWWPEMDTGGGLAEYMHTQPSDPAQFYAIRTWKRTPRWRWEDWDAHIPGYVEDAIAGQVRGKATPADTSRRLLGLAVQTEQALEQARTKGADRKSAEGRSTQVDLEVLAQLARYHAAKTQAATHLAFFELTGAKGRLQPALSSMRTAAAAWQRIAKRTDGVYHDNLVFGITRDSPRSRLGHHHSGHWKDRLAEIQEDVAFLERLQKQHGGDGQRYHTFPGEVPLTELPQVEHQPVATVRAGEDLTITARVRSRLPLQRVLLHYRPLDQTVDWKQVPMRPAGADRVVAQINAKEITARWDLQYYLEVLVAGGGGRLWPAWEHGPPYVVIQVNRPRPPR